MKFQIPNSKSQTNPKIQISNHKQHGSRGSGICLEFLHLLGFVIFLEFGICDLEFNAEVAS